MLVQFVHQSLINAGDIDLADSTADRQSVPGAALPVRSRMGGRVRF
jgi:hypothetical protein